MANNLNFHKSHSIIHALSNQNTSKHTKNVDSKKSNSSKLTYPKIFRLLSR